LKKNKSNNFRKCYISLELIEIGYYAIKDKRKLPDRLGDLNKKKDNVNNTFLNMLVILMSELTI